MHANMKWGQSSFSIKCRPVAFGRACPGHARRVGIPISRATSNGYPVRHYATEYFRSDLITRVETRA